VPPGRHAATKKKRVLQKDQKIRRMRSGEPSLPLLIFLIFLFNPLGRSLLLGGLAAFSI
jgi:hypothetical protein